MRVPPSGERPERDDYLFKRVDSGVKDDNFIYFEPLIDNWREETKQESR